MMLNLFNFMTLKRRDPCRAWVSIIATLNSAWNSPVGIVRVFLSYCYSGCCCSVVVFLSPYRLPSAVLCVFDYHSFEQMRRPRSLSLSKSPPEYVLALSY